MMIKERSWSSSSYRFGFNGQEKDDEVSGAGNSYTAQFWQYDSRLGRRWNVDPIVKHFFSSYQTFSNNPIIFIDPNGDDDYYNKAGKYVGSSGTAIRVINKINISKKSFEQAKNSSSMMSFINESSEVLRIQENQQEVLEALYTNNSEPGSDEKVAFFILDVENATLSIVEQNVEGTNNQSKNEYTTWSGGSNGDYITIKGDKSKIIVGQIHTHPPNKDGSYPLPKVSDENSITETKGAHDVNAAKEMGVPVFAIDKDYIHKASPDGSVANKMSKTTEVLRSSLEESGGKNE